jgi:hypothetical protein
VTKLGDFAIFSRQLVKPGFQFTAQLSISVSPLLDLSCRADIDWTLEESMNTTQDP